MAVVHRDGRSEVHTAGVAEVGAQGEPSEDLTIRIASVSKAFSGATALSMVQQGQLSLDDTVGERLPEQPSAWHPVTLRQLLQHTSGLPDFTASDAFAEAVTAEPADPPAPVDLLAFVAEDPLVFEPGSQYAYSNSDNVAVGLMVETATDASYEAVLALDVTGPGGLGDTSFPAGTDLAAPYLHGYDVSGDEPEDVSQVVAFGGWAWASGGLVSTADQLGRFVRSLLGGEFFGDTVRNEQHDVVSGESEPAGPGDNAAGLGLFRYDTRCGTVWGHTGSVLGYTQFMAASADGSASVVFTVSTQVGDDELLAQLRDAQELAVCDALEG